MKRFWQSKIEKRKTKIRKGEFFHVTSYRTAGRLVPPSARGLRSRTVALKPGGVMDWHTTDAREELIVVFNGRVMVEVETRAAVRRSVALRAGQSLFLPSHTPHRVVNRSCAAATYLYVTAPVIRGVTSRPQTSDLRHPTSATTSRTPKHEV
jgi:quercetin dioxygenase-like cupin family protein